MRSVAALILRLALTATRDHTALGREMPRQQPYAVGVTIARDARLRYPRLWDPPVAPASQGTFVPQGLPLAAHALQADIVMALVGSPLACARQDTTAPRGVRQLPLLARPPTGGLSATNAQQVTGMCMEEWIGRRGEGGRGAY